MLIRGVVGSVAIRHQVKVLGTVLGGSASVSVLPPPAHAPSLGYLLVP